MRSEVLLYIFLKLWKQIQNQIIGRNWESFDLHTRKSQYCHEGYVKGNSDKNSERKEENWREKFHLLREHINNHVQNIGKT